MSDNKETDLPEQILNRFWEISATGYTIKPELTNLTFTCTNADYTATGNAINEDDLKPMQWNSDAKDWRNFSHRATLNTEVNSLTIHTVAANRQYSYWIMSGTGAMVLPVHFIRFTASATAPKPTWFGLPQQKKTMIISW